MDPADWFFIRLFETFQWKLFSQKFLAKTFHWTNSLKTQEVQEPHKREAATLLSTILLSVTLVSLQNELRKVQMMATFFGDGHMFVCSMYILLTFNKVVTLVIHWTSSKYEPKWSVPQSIRHQLRKVVKGSEFFYESPTVNSQMICQWILCVLS